MTKRSIWAVVAGVLVISVGGAWLTARLAPDKPMKHVMMLGVVSHLARRAGDTAVLTGCHLCDL